MKTWKRILCGCLMLLFVLSVSGPVCGLAADRNYEINFYGGNGGSVSGTVGGPYTAGSGTVAARIRETMNSIPAVRRQTETGTM